LNKNSEFGSPQINDLALCAEYLKNQDEKHKNIKLHLIGTLYYLFYENEKEKPYRRASPVYTDLVLPPESTQSSSQLTDAITSEIAVEPLRRLSKKKLKKVYMQAAHQEDFEDILVKRSMLLEHIPNSYDKSFNRAFETLMIYLSKNS
jgi:hypothetical protein